MGVHNFLRVVLLVGVLLLTLRISQSYAVGLPTVDGDEVVSQLKRLATFTDSPNPSVTRILFTPADVKARQYVKSLMTDAGLRLRGDSMGNIYGLWEGSEREAGAVVTGSHCDAIPLSGMYDGTLGVIGGIAALKALKETGFKPRRSIEVMMFTSEEPTRFGLGCIGSRAMAGVLTAETLDEKKDVNGSTFAQAATEVGYHNKGHQDIVDRARVKEGAIASFVELHIEQGPNLEDKGLQLGIVTAIAAPAALRVTFHGDGGHAGALLMPYRNDAGLAAAELALHVESATLVSGAIDTVGTTGLFEIRPNAVNSVPRDAKLEVDIRDIDGKRRDTVVQSVKDAVQEIAARRKVRYSIEVINQDPPATCSNEVINAAEESAKQLGATYQRMVSRAYHDSLFMAQIAPTGMIFIPCRGGVSHRPDEYSSPEDVARGVKALALTLARLAGSADTGDRSEL